MTGESAVRIAVVLPDLLGTYGDRGNSLVLAQRLRWRGLAAEIVDVPRGAPVPGRCDVYLLGGGEDVAEIEAVRLLRSSAFPAAVQRGAPVLAVCAGLQILGTSITELSGQTHAGLDLIDVRTEPAGRRAIGEVVAHADPALGLSDTLLSGFENHRGHTMRGAGVAALASVQIGSGNGDGTEGVVCGAIVGTYLHGPVLARNPALADRLLEAATGIRATPLHLPDVAELRDAATRQARRRTWRARRPRRWLTPGLPGPGR